MSVLPLPPQMDDGDDIGNSSTGGSMRVSMRGERLIQFVRFYLGNKDDSEGTYWTLKVDEKMVAQDICVRIARNLGVSRGTFKLVWREQQQQGGPWRDIDEIEPSTRMWDVCAEIRTNGMLNKVKLFVVEKEGRKVVMSRAITFSPERLRRLDASGRGEAVAMHAAGAKRGKKEKAASAEVGNWQPRVPRKGEKMYTKFFHDDVSRLKSRRHFLEKLVVFKAFHRDLQEETFVYKSQAEQNRGRQDLLDVGQWLLENLDICPEAEQNTFFGSLLFIIKRQEFNVCDLQFDVAMKPRFNNDTILTMLRYRKFLFDTQLYVQRNLMQEQLYPSLLSFCASILAINYFYIDGLAELLLSRCWTNEQDNDAQIRCPELKEYIDYVQQTDKEDTMKETRSSDMWLGTDRSSPSIAYFCMLKSLFGALVAAGRNSNMRKDVRTLSPPTQMLDSEWLGRMVEQGEFFHIFLLEWLAQIAYFIGSYKKIKWGLIPGYYTWLTIVLQQMIETPLIEWTEEFIQTTDSFLLNPKLLSIFVKITFRKTNINAQDEVESTLRLIDGWIDLLPVNVDEETGTVEALPPSFDYAFFVAGLRMLLVNDHFVVLLETLLLLYNHLDRFVGRWRVALLDDLLFAADTFRRLFFCWNHHVRYVYHLLLVFKLGRFPGNVCEARQRWDNVELLGGGGNANNSNNNSNFAALTAGPMGVTGGGGPKGDDGDGDGDGDSSASTDVDSNGGGGGREGGRRSGGGGGGGSKKRSGKSSAATDEALAKEAKHSLNIKSGSSGGGGGGSTKERTSSSKGRSRSSTHDKRSSKSAAAAADKGGGGGGGGGKSSSSSRKPGSPGRASRELRKSNSLRRLSSDAEDKEKGGGGGGGGGAFDVQHSTLSVRGATARAATGAGGVTALEEGEPGIAVIEARTAHAHAAALSDVAQLRAELESVDALGDGGDGDGVRALKFAAVGGVGRYECALPRLAPGSYVLSAAYGGKNFVGSPLSLVVGGKLAKRISKRAEKAAAGGEKAERKRSSTVDGSSGKDRHAADDSRSRSARGAHESKKGSSSGGGGGGGGGDGNGKADKDKKDKLAPPAVPPTPVSPSSRKSRSSTTSKVEKGGGGGADVATTKDRTSSSKHSGRSRGATVDGSGGGGGKKAAAASKLAATVTKAEAAEEDAEYPPYGFKHCPRISDENRAKYGTVYNIDHEREIDLFLQAKIEFLYASVMKQAQITFDGQRILLNGGGGDGGGGGGKKGKGARGGKSRSSSNAAAAAKQPPVKLFDLTPSEATYARYSFEEMRAVREEFAQFQMESGGECDGVLGSRLCKPLDQEAVMERDFNRHTAAFTERANAANRAMYGDAAPVLSVPTLDELEEQDDEEELLEQEGSNIPY